MAEYIAELRVLKVDCVDRHFRIEIKKWELVCKAAPLCAICITSSKDLAIHNKFRSD